MALRPGAQHGRATVGDLVGMAAGAFAWVPLTVFVIWAGSKAIDVDGGGAFSHLRNFMSELGDSTSCLRNDQPAPSTAMP